MTPLILYVAYIRMETENAWIIISWVSWYHWTRDVTGPLHPAAGAGWALSLNSGNLSSSSARRRTHATTATASPVLEDKTQLWEWCGGAVVPRLQVHQPHHSRMCAVVLCEAWHWLQHWQWHQACALLLLHSGPGPPVDTVDSAGPGSNGMKHTR